ncbi:uncharacterized protein LOC111390610 [Olea europaea var. sylvestris]|uniref:uncharacterized protein LOC111390610 n=1 Tax=Olea europaea var. sylvestris TaxID=158386 RepID=UPI000C1CD060|nr:uncharacterized protein LOC111390610 [Olea europaea var. sylvestris]
MEAEANINRRNCKTIFVYIRVLQPTEEELHTLWYTTLSLPLDNKHTILDGIVTGELDNIVPQISHSNCVQQTINADDAATSRTYTLVGVWPNYASVDCNYVTKEQMEEIFSTHRQYVSGLYGDLKAHRLKNQENNRLNILKTRSKYLKNSKNGTNINIKSCTLLTNLVYNLYMWILKLSAIIFWYTHG